MIIKNFVSFSLLKTYFERTAMKNQPSPGGEKYPEEPGGNGREEKFVPGGPDGRGKTSRLTPVLQLSVAKNALLFSKN